MHCPTCRIDNAATTRFCTSCGAVLVEEAPGGGRRRVLRPWGLRRSAPLTISPDFPDLALAPETAEAGDRRLDLWLAGGVALIVVLVAMLHPWLRRTEAAPLSHADERMVAAPAVVTVTPAAIVKETRLVAPALVEPAPQRTRTEGAAAKPAAPAAAPPSTHLGGARGLPAVAVTYAVPARELLVGDGESVESPPQRVAAPVRAPDRWQPLRADLEACKSLGLFERATCEQTARLAHCESYWGYVPECPQWRAEVR